MREIKWRGKRGRWFWITWDRRVLASCDDITIGPTDSFDSFTTNFEVNSISFAKLASRGSGRITRGGSVIFLKIFLINRSNASRDKSISVLVTSGKCLRGSLTISAATELRRRRISGSDIDCSDQLVSAVAVGFNSEPRRSPRRFSTTSLTSVASRLSGITDIC